MTERRVRGSVTAEFALVLPALVFVLVALLAVGRLTVDQIRCLDGARAGARLAARGEPSSRVRAVAEQAAPPGAQVEVALLTDLVRVDVAAVVRLPPPIGWQQVRAAAVAMRELG